MAAVARRERQVAELRVVLATIVPGHRGMVTLLMGGQVEERIFLWPVCNGVTGVPEIWCVYKPGGDIAFEELSTWARVKLLKRGQGYPDGQSVTFENAIEDGEMRALVQQGRDRAEMSERAGRIAVFRSFVDWDGLDLGAPPARGLMSRLRTRVIGKTKEADALVAVDGNLGSDT